MEETIKNEPKTTFVSELFDWVEALVYAIVLVVLLLTFVFRIITIEGTSMLPTVKDGDRIITTSLFYKPHRGDVVVITQPNDVTNKPLIKRIIGVDGDTIDIDFVKGIVTRNGKVLDEPYINEKTNRSFDVKFPLTVPKGKLFVMGDNRNHSSDSRVSSIGFIDKGYILGKTTIRIFPINKFDIIK